MPENEVAPDIRPFLEVRSAIPSNFSPDATKVLIQSNLSGTAQLYTVPREGGPLTRITSFDDPVSGTYLPTTDDIVISMASGGNERTQLSLMPDSGTDVLPLVDDPDHIYRVGGVTRDGTALAYASNARNGTDFDISVLPLDGSDPRIVFGRGGWCQARGFSPDGRWLSVARLTERSGDNDLYLVDISTGEILEIAPHTDAAYVGAPAWFADASAFYFATDVDRDTSAIAMFDLETRAWHYVLEREEDTGCVMNWPGTALLVTSSRDGYTDATLVNPRTLEPVRPIGLPSHGVADFAFSRDGRYLAYSFTSPVQPSDAWCYDIETGDNARLTESPCAVDLSSLVEPVVERVTSFDGEHLALFVYRPPGGSRSNAPVVVYLHGGPESQHTPEFNPLIAWLVGRGYAVVAPNVRGSTGYGKRFEHLDDGRRRGHAIADLGCIHEWIRGQSQLDERRCALMGGSYGGYLAVAGLAFQPERWRAGVSLVGISSLTTFLEKTSQWRRSAREAEYGSLARDRSFLDEVSPLNHADDIRAPLFLVHGANDPRVPLGEAQQIHDTVRANGIRSHLEVYADEGHGLSRLSNRVDAYTKIAAFLDEELRPGS